MFHVRKGGENYVGRKNKRSIRFQRGGGRRGQLSPPIKERKREAHDTWYMRGGGTFSVAQRNGGAVI